MGWRTLIRAKLMICVFPESSHRAAARGTVPDRFRLIPEEFLMKLLTILRKSGFLSKNKDSSEKVAPKIEVPAPRRARYVPAFQKYKNHKNSNNENSNISFFSFCSMFQISNFL